MADDSFFTDSDDDRAVQSILSQALDHSVLEQVAAINCSSFSTSDNLPFDLENRFRKLKSLPATSASVAGAVSRFPATRSKSFTHKSGIDSNSYEQRHQSSKFVDFEHVSDPKNCSDENRYEKKRANSRSKPKSETETDSDSVGFERFSDLKNCTAKSNPEEEKKRANSRSKPKSETDTDSFDLERNSDLKNCSEKSSPSEHSDEKKRAKSRSKPKKSVAKSRSGTGSSESWSLPSPDSESEPSSGSESPARRGFGCLWCSPKKEKEKRKQGKENRFSASASSSVWGNEYNDVEFLKTFSVKEQKKIMKQAMKEEERVNKEAEKIVKWAKQASARMMDVDVSGGVVDDDELTDVEDHHRR